MSKAKRRRCIGWGDKEGRCYEPAGSKHSRLWCQPCDSKRMAHLDKQFAALLTRAPEEPEGEERK